MKANELMIGDWVKSRGKIEQVRSVYDGFICTDSFEDSHDYYFAPIPITPEILEKNGFTRSNERVRYFTESTDYYDVDIHEITDSIWCFEYQNLEAHFPPCLILIAHVHELQHALRLCGIEKEIEL